MDEAMGKCVTYSQFKKIMYKKGYIINDDNNRCRRRPGGECVSSGLSCCKDSVNGGKYKDENRVFDFIVFEELFTFI